MKLLEKLMKVPIFICYECGWIDDDYLALAAEVLACRHCDNQLNYKLLITEKEARAFLDKEPFQSKK
jgi:hypothetical protein